MCTILGYIVSLILLNLMFHQEASVETVKMIFEPVSRGLFHRCNHYFDVTDFNCLLECGVSGFLTSQFIHRDLEN